MVAKARFLLKTCFESFESLDESLFDTVLLSLLNSLQTQNPLPKDIYLLQKEQTFYIMYIVLLCMNLEDK